MLSLVKQHTVRFFQFPALNCFPELVHAVGCRLDGFSLPPYGSLNLGQGVGDDPAVVTANRNRWRQATGGGLHVYTRQNHGTTIRVIKTNQIEQGQGVQTGSAPADALLTNVPGIRLLILTADCQAVMLYDPQTRVVANIHCGWRGSVANLIGRVVSRMIDEFDCDPRQMVAAIGPSLGPCCAEFVHYKDEIPMDLWPFRVGGNHFDFWRISRHQLVTAGLWENHIHDAAICTLCNAHLFFSYRAERQTGRFGSMIALA